MKIFHNPKLKIIDFADERFYTVDQLKYYPSSTTILGVYPKGYGFNEYLKKLGFNADDELRKAGEQGTKIHDAIDRYLHGEELLWVSETGNANYTVEEWKMINRFVEFENTYKPETLAQELSLLDEDLGYGGTIDRVCLINGEVWLIDYKSSNYIHKGHELQLASYIALWNRFNPEQKVQKHGILHLKAQTRGESKTSGVMQGKGWQLKPYERPWHDAFKLFDYTKQIWHEENPNYVPKNEQYPDRLQKSEWISKVADTKGTVKVDNSEKVKQPEPAPEAKAQLKKVPKGWGETNLPIDDPAVEITY